MENVMVTHQRTPRLGEMWRSTDDKGTVRIAGTRLGSADERLREVTCRILTGCNGRPVAPPHYPLTFSLLDFRELYEFGGERGPRQMPSMKVILRHRGFQEARCVRCGYGGYLERAHIIDRFLGGLDNPANFAPLCDECHRNQPIFEPGDEAEALRWFRLPAL
jgi:hypothetical protein